MSASKSPKIAAEFTRTREFIRRYSVLAEDELDIVTVWAMGTWTFSPSSPATPATYPYLYITGARGSGKSVLGQDGLGSLCRNPQNTVGATGPAMFRMIGDYDAETGEVTPMYPTLTIDEIDATFNGAKDEALRQVLNAGYRRGSTVPRAAGRTTIAYPVHCPKIMMGIDNGHLPDTVADRSIRIEMRRATPEQMATVEPFYVFDVEDEAAELAQQLANWATDNAMVLRDYRPEPIPDLQPRQWEIARSLVQLAHAVGNEKRIREALHNVMTRNPERPDHKVTLYRSILNLFDETGEDRLTSRQLLERLIADGVTLSGTSPKSVSSALASDGIEPEMVRLRPTHCGYDPNRAPTQRGYYRNRFDAAFNKYLANDDTEDC